MIDKTKVTCVRWVPKSKHLFLVSHMSGQLYLYNETFTCGTSVPSYQQVKSGEGYTVYVCKTKSSRNPMYRWVIGCDGSCINEFEFSPCGLYLAVVSQDGFLRVFDYEKMDLVGIARSYFGGFLCVCWSPDSRYILFLIKASYCKWSGVNCGTKTFLTPLNICSVTNKVYWFF